MIQKAYLVYQGGIANVFAVDFFKLSPEYRNARRLMQADFHACVNFCRGFAAAGGIVQTAACNEAGDITNRPWTNKLENQPFSDKIVVVTANVLRFNDDDPIKPAKIGAAIK